MCHDETPFDGPDAQSTDSQCNTDNCTGAQIADWGVCRDCYIESRDRIIERVFGEDSDD